MGLAYNLDVTLYDNFGKYLPNALVDFANQDPFILGVPPLADTFQGVMGSGGWEHRWCGYANPAEAYTQYIFPTGEYVIRDVAFINGYMVFVGSYKAYFRDLYGVGNSGYAWDGFIMTLRNYSYDNLQTIPWSFNSDTGAYGGLANITESGWGFMPMRMPMDISPGAIGDAATIAADSSVGLMAVDIWKGGNDTEVGAPNAPDAANVKIITVGHQRIGDPVGQGMVYTDIDYVGFMWMTQICKQTLNTDDGSTPEIIPFASQPYVGSPATENNIGNPATQVNGDFIIYLAERSSTYQISWRATSNYTCFLPPPLSSPADQTRLFDWDAWLSIGEQNTGGFAGLYDTRVWSDGCKPNATSWNGGAVCPDDTSAATWNYYPRKLYDITAASQITRTGGGKVTTTLSPWTIGGDFCVGGDSSVPSPTLLGTFPAVIGCALDSTFSVIEPVYTDPADKAAYLGPYMIAHVGGVSTRATFGTSAFEFNGSFTSGSPPSLNGAYVAFCMIPFELMNNNTTGQDNPSNRTPMYQYAVNGMTDGGGTKGCGIFYAAQFPQDPGNIIASYLAPDMSNGASTALPEKWVAKLMQSRTFTVEEEGRSKDQNYYGTIPPGLDPVVIGNSNTTPNLPPEPVGVISNYQRYGLDDDPDGSLGERQQMGNPTRQCYGLLGHRSGVGPICYLFDSGRGWEKNNSFPIGNPNYAAVNQWSNTILERGAAFNNQFIVNANSVNRRAVWASWDNDRDQWLFLFSDPTFGVGSIGATSTFTNTVTTVAFLDQTPNFARIAPTETANYQTAMWNAFLMSNNMDGIVLFGGDDLTNSKTGDIFGYTGVGADNKYWVSAVQQSTGTQTWDDSWYQGGAAITSDFNPSTIQWFNISGSTGRTARVWVDYILFDGADAVIATKLRERGMKVTIEAVEWFKRKIINSGDLNIKQEEIEMWMREQQDEFQQMMQDAERMGRVRKRKKQVSAYGLDMSEVITPDFEDKEVQEFMKEYLPQSRPPTPEEQAIDKQRKGGYAPFSKNYYDEVFEN